VPYRRLQESIGLFGHISIRNPGTDVGGDRPMQIPADWRIHTQIHKDRPEIGSVAHLHAHASTLPGIARKPIQPVFAQGALFKDGVPVWDNLRLVVTDEMAISLSKSLGDKRACQMRGHGSVVVGKWRGRGPFIVPDRLLSLTFYNMRRQGVGNANGRRR
jgi:ribulose-5-phosphate 4-epimerase/fuculose-1-phosphate aldolase